MKISRVVIFILIITAFGAGIYFKDDAIKFYNSFNKGVQKSVQNIEKTKIGQTLNQVRKEILTPPPLNIGGQPEVPPKKTILLQSDVIAETNLQRQENSLPGQGILPALTENVKLDDTASAKANDMFLNQYFEHTSPSGVGPGELAQKYGYNYIVEGENLILGNFSSEKEVVQDWMNSPGHRANILNNRYTEIGAAIIKGTYKGETVWIGVQEFGLPMSACSEPNPSLRVQIDSYNTQLDSFSSQIDEYKKQIDNTDASSLAYPQMVSDYNRVIKQYNSLAEIIKSIVADYNKQVNTFNNCIAGK